MPIGTNTLWDQNPVEPMPLESMLRGTYAPRRKHPVVKPPGTKAPFTLKYAAMVCKVVGKPLKSEMFNNNNNLTFIMRLGNAMQTQRGRSLHIGKTHDQHLEASCRGISSC